MEDCTSLTSGQKFVARLDPSGSIQTLATPQGLNPIAAIFVALWYSFACSAAMSSGFGHIPGVSKHGHNLAKDVMCAFGFGLGIGIGTYSARNLRIWVGSICSVLISGLLLLPVLFSWSNGASDVSLLGFRPSEIQLESVIAALALLLGFIGTATGKAVNGHEFLGNATLGIRRGHWLWLWMAVWAWVYMLPLSIYYVWLEIVSTAFSLIHPSLLFNEVWTEGRTFTFGVLGFFAMIHGIKISILNVSAGYSSHVPIRKRVLRFLLGTLVFTGAMAGFFFVFAIDTLRELPNGITSNPWWILR